jgi:hypothetical protein
MPVKSVEKLLLVDFQEKSTLKGSMLSRQMKMASRIRGGEDGFEKDAELEDIDAANVNERVSVIFM